uniref:Uncharacterized protein n=1 Tax=Loa loa TaxID=7209 RepID=A0A1I7VIQ7_LOALO
MDPPANSQSVGKEGGSGNVENDKDAILGYVKGWAKKRRYAKEISREEEFLEVSGGEEKKWKEGEIWDNWNGILKAKKGVEKPKSRSQPLFFLAYGIFLFLGDPVRFT